MKIIETNLPGLVVIEPRVFKDTRGYFFESFNKASFEQQGISHEFVQDNESKSSRGVIRGLHYQLEPHAQTKLVRVLSGSVWDVAVDLRKGSPTFGQSFSIELSAENKLQLYIPRGFAHGFAVMSDVAVFFYKCNNLYHPPSERGIFYADQNLAIDWQLPLNEHNISDKDKLLPKFEDADCNFTY